DATSAPHLSDPAVVDAPAERCSRSAQLHVALSVRDYLRRVQGVLEVVEETSGLGGRLRVGSREDLLRAQALVLERREDAGVDGLGDEGERHTQLQGVDRGPLAGALLACDVEDLVDQR